MLNVDESISHYSRSLYDTLQSIPERAPQKLVDMIFEVLSHGGTVAICGNGGSHTTGAHLACDLVRHKIKLNGRGKIVTLCSNMALLSAIANDFDYSEIFASEVRNLLTPGDLLLCLSVSGNSRNVLKAVEVAAEHGIRVAALTGQGGGQLAESPLVEFVVKVNSDKVYLVEDAHHALCHFISEQVARRFLSF